MSRTLTKSINQGCFCQSDGLLRLHEKSRWHLLLFHTLRHMNQTFKARAKHLLPSDFSFLEVTIIQGTNTMQHNVRYIGSQTTFRLHCKLQGSHFAHLWTYYGVTLQQLSCLKFWIQAVTNQYVKGMQNIALERSDLREGCVYPHISDDRLSSLIWALLKQNCIVILMWQNTPDMNHPFIFCINHSKMEKKPKPKVL